MGNPEDRFCCVEAHITKQIHKEKDLTRNIEIQIIVPDKEIL